MWSLALAQLHPELNVVAVNPGSLLNTKMVQEAYGHHWSGADKGADILCELATSQDLGHRAGDYFDNDLGNPRGDFGPAHPDARDLQKMTTLVQATEHLLAAYTG